MKCSPRGIHSCVYMHFKMTMLMMMMGVFFLRGSATADRAKGALAARLKFLLSKHYAEFIYFFLQSTGTQTNNNKRENL